MLYVPLYIFISLSLALCGGRTQNRKQEIIGSWRNGMEWNMLLISNTFPSWLSGDKKMTNVSEWRRWDRESWEGNGTCSFIRPFTPVATATCLEGTHERRRHWQKQLRGREWVRSNESKLMCLNQLGEQKVGSRSTTESFLRLKEVWVWPSGTLLRSIMNIHSSLEVILINVCIAQLKFHQQLLQPRSWVWISLISSPEKRILLWDMKLSELIKPRLMPNILN